MQPEKDFILRMQEHLRMNHFPYFPDEDMWGRRVLYDFEHQEIRFLYEEETPLREDLTPYSLGRRLSALHQASAGFELSQDHTRNRYGKWQDYWFQKVKRIQKFRDQLYQTGVSSLFEELFLEDYTYFNQLTQVALFYLEDHQYQDLVQQLEPTRSLAYRAFSWNDVEQNDSGIIFVHPENWIIDLSARDLGSFVRTSSMDHLSLDESILFLQGYQQNKELLPAEYHMIYAQLLYPHHWVHLIEKYTARHKYSRMDWEREIREVSQRYQGWEPILAEFADRVEEEFGVNVTPIEWLR